MSETPPLPASPRFQNLTGRTYGGGQVRVESFAGRTPKGEDFLWTCVCACGARFTPRGKDLKKGDTKSCGCRKAELVSRGRSTHGGSRGGARSPEYRTWCLMMSRCHNERGRDYAYYGGRGVTVCERWHDFANFLADMGPRPSPAHSLDRFPDNESGHYEPGNCRWATRTEQMNNTRSNHHLSFRGETHTVAEWARILNIRHTLIFDRLRWGWSVEETLTVPPRPLRRRKSDGGVSNA